MPARDGPTLAIEPGLAAEAVRLAVERLPLAERRRFHREREPIYRLAEAERREESFRDLDARWLVRAGIRDRVLDRLAGEPEIGARIGRCRVLPPAGRGAEYADLAAEAPGEARQRLLALFLLPATLADPERLAALLRRELLFVADLLDPAFAFDPEPGAPRVCAEHLARYRLLWAITVDGRLDRRGEAGPEVAAERWREFRLAFPALGEAAPAWFDHWFHAGRVSHPRLLEFACRPPGPAAPPGGPPVRRAAPGAPAADGATAGSR